jgi:hypothetical protein
MREFLKGLELDKDTIDTIMAEHGKIITADKEKITNLENDIKAKSDLLKTANDEIASYKTMDIEAIKKSGEEYKTKFEDAEKNYNLEIAKRDKRDAIKDKLLDAGIEFSSEYAKNGVLAELLENESLTIDKNGKLVGFDDVFKGIQEVQPKAFIVKDGQGQEKNPQTPPPMYAGAGKDPITPTEADMMKKSYQDAVKGRNTTEMARIIRVASEKGVNLDK